MFQELKLLGKLLILHGISVGGLEFDPYLPPLHLSFKIPHWASRIKKEFEPTPGGGVRIMWLND